MRNGYDALWLETTNSSAVFLIQQDSHILNFGFKLFKEFLQVSFISDSIKSLCLTLEKLNSFKVGICIVVYNRGGLLMTCMLQLAHGRSGSGTGSTVANWVGSRKSSRLGRGRGLERYLGRV